MLSASVTTAELIQAVASAAAVLVGALLAARQAWVKVVRPWFKVIHTEAAAVNAAVNHVPAGTPALVDRVRALEITLATVVSTQTMMATRQREIQADVTLIKDVIVNNTPPAGTPQVEP